MIKYFERFAEKHRFDPWTALWLSLISFFLFQASDAISVYFAFPSGIVVAFIIGYFVKNKNYLLIIRVVSFILIFPSEYYRDHMIVEKYCKVRLTTAECLELLEERDRH